MAERNNKPTPRAYADLETISGNLLEAMAMLETAIKSLDADDGGGPELVVLERTLRDLGTLSNELERHV